MEFKINGGAWPTMITLFTTDGKLDESLNRLAAKRLADMGSGGIFAVCQSSEMFFLNIEEKVALAHLVKEEIGTDVSLVVSGHTAESLEEQISDLKRMNTVGADALVLVTNRLDPKNEGFETFKKNTQAILNALPDAVFGLYECPYPFLRLLSDEELIWCAKTGRIRFLKDVSCNAEVQTRRVKLTEGTQLKLYNANTETLLHSLRCGYTGYNGVMGNFHIDLYKWLCTHIDDVKADYLQKELFDMSTIEKVSYPVNAKYYLQLKGYNVSVFTRSKSQDLLSEEEKDKVLRQLKRETALRGELNLSMQR